MEFIAFNYHFFDLPNYIKWLETPEQIHVKLWPNLKNFLKHFKMKMSENINLCVCVRVPVKIRNYLFLRIGYFVLPCWGVVRGMIWLVKNPPGLLQLQWPYNSVISENQRDVNQKLQNLLLQLIATKSVNKRSVEGLGIYANKEYFQTKLDNRVLR